MNVRSLICWGPQYWKDIKFKRYLWKRVHEGYSSLLRQKRDIEYVISKYGSDAFTEEEAVRAVSKATDAWVKVKVPGHSFQNIEFKSLELTPREIQIYYEYREVGYNVFYRCCEIVYSTRLSANQISLEKWQEYMEGVREQEAVLGVSYRRDPSGESVQSRRPISRNAFPILF